MASKRRMPFRDAIALVPDDLPDGAYWAMAHEIAGLDYGDGFDELGDDNPFDGRLSGHECFVCHRVFDSPRALQQHVEAKAHTRRAAREAK